MSDCYGSKCSIGDWQATPTAPSVEQSVSGSIGPERQVLNLMDTLRETTWRASYAGQLGDIRGQVTYLRETFIRFLQGQLKPIPADDPFVG